MTDTAKLANDRARVAGIWCTRKSITERPHADTCGVAPGGMKLGSKQLHHAGVTSSNPHESRIPGQVGQEAHRDLRCWRTRRPVFSSRPAFLRSSARHVSAALRLGLSAAKRTKCCHNCCQRSQAQPFKSAENEAKMGRWDRNRTCNLRFWRPNPACRGVSHAVATCRSAPLLLSPCVAECRQVSPVTGADTGADQKQPSAFISPGHKEGSRSRNGIM